MEGLSFLNAVLKNIQQGRVQRPIGGLCYEAGLIS